MTSPKSRMINAVTKKKLWETGPAGGQEEPGHAQTWP